MGSKTPVINADNLGKEYRIRPTRGRETLREALVRGFQTAGAALVSSRRSADDSENILWALRHASFTVAEGSILGVIGKNGAGKSTLLKLLSRITDPTEGRAEIFGTVGSLLEVGAGFHHELTGAENVFLSGAVLGMRRSEIARRFDEIMDFADVAKFANTPVKHYSSGMYLRLAFSVMAHLDSSILIVDEVLAVGDAAFQQRCLQRMRDLTSGGRTVVFVSHSMSAIARLCDSCLVLERGNVVFNGRAGDAINQYLKIVSDETERDSNSVRRPEWARPLISNTRLLAADGTSKSHFSIAEPLSIELDFDCGDEPPLSDPVMGVVVNRVGAGPVGNANSRVSGFRTAGRKFSRGTIRCDLRHVPLIQGRYSIDIWFGTGETDLDCVESALTFEIEETDVHGSGVAPDNTWGPVLLQPSWEIVNSESTNF